MESTLTPSQKAILEAARQAPSADNSCPWQWDWTGENELVLNNDKDRSGKATDNTYILTNLAMGAAVENAVLKALDFKLSADVEYRHQGTDIIVTIQFAPLDGEIEVNEQNKLASQIELRHSDRRFPFKGNVTEQQFSQLAQSIQHPGCQLLSFNEKSAIKAVEPTIRKAEAVRFKDETLHAELFDTVKFGESNPEEGMTLPVLGIEPPARPMFRMLKSWPVMKALNHIGASKLIAIRSVTLPILNSPALAMITSPSDESADVFSTGRQIQRVWLKATELGLAVHLYAAPGVLSLANPPLAADLSSVLTEVKAELDDITQGKGHAIMFFRLGEKPGDVPRSNRRALNSLKNTRQS